MIEGGPQTNSLRLVHAASYENHHYTKQDWAVDSALAMKLQSPLPSPLDFLFSYMTTELT